MSESTPVNRDERYRIVAEVPGVPASERFFVTGPEFRYPHPKFSTYRQAKDFLAERGITEFSYEPFEP